MQFDEILTQYAVMQASDERGTLHIRNCAETLLGIFKCGGREPSKIYQLLQKTLLELGTQLPESYQKYHKQYSSHPKQLLLYQFYLVLRNPNRFLSLCVMYYMQLCSVTEKLYEPGSIWVQPEMFKQAKAQLASVSTELFEREAELPFTSFLPLSESAEQIVMEFDGCVDDTERSLAALALALQRILLPTSISSFGDVLTYFIQTLAVQSVSPFKTLCNSFGLMDTAQQIRFPQFASKESTTIAMEYLLENDDILMSLATKLSDIAEAKRFQQACGSLYRQEHVIFDPVFWNRMMSSLTALKARRLRFVCKYQYAVQAEQQIFEALADKIELCDTGYNNLNDAVFKQVKIFSTNQTPLQLQRVLLLLKVLIQHGTDASICRQIVSAFPSDSLVQRTAGEIVAEHEDEFITTFLRLALQKSLLDGAFDFYFHALTEGKLRNCYRDEAYLLNRVNQEFLHRVTQVLQKATKGFQYWGALEAPCSRLDYLLQEFLVSPELAGNQAQLTEYKAKIKITPQMEQIDFQYIYTPTPGAVKLPEQFEFLKMKEAQLNADQVDGLIEFIFGKLTDGAYNKDTVHQLVYGAFIYLLEKYKAKNFANVVQINDGINALSSPSTKTVFIIRSCLQEILLGELLLQLDQQINSNLETSLTLYYYDAFVFRCLRPLASLIKLTKVTLTTQYQSPEIQSRAESEQQCLSQKFVASLKQLISLQNDSAQTISESHAKFGLSLQTLAQFGLLPSRAPLKVLRGFIAERQEWRVSKTSILDVIDQQVALCEVKNPATHEQCAWIALFLWAFRARLLDKLIKDFSVYVKTSGDYAPDAVWMQQQVVQELCNEIKSMQETLQISFLVADIRALLPARDGAYEIVSGLEKAVGDEKSDRFYQSLVAFFIKQTETDKDHGEFIRALLTRVDQGGFDPFLQEQQPSFDTKKIWQHLEAVSQKAPCFGGRVQVEIVIRGFCETTDGAFLLAAKLAGLFERDTRFILTITEHLERLKPKAMMQLFWVLARNRGQQLQSNVLVYGGIFGSQLHQQVLSCADSYQEELLKFQHGCSFYTLNHFLNQIAQSLVATDKWQYLFFLTEVVAIVMTHKKNVVPAISGGDGEFDSYLIVWKQLTGASKEAQPRKLLENPKFLSQFQFNAYLLQRPNAAFLQGIFDIVSTWASHQPEVLDMQEYEVQHMRLISLAGQNIFLDPAHIPARNDVYQALNQQFDFDAERPLLPCTDEQLDRCVGQLKEQARLLGETSSLDLQEEQLESISASILAVMSCGAFDSEDMSAVLQSWDTHFKGPETELITQVLPQIKARRDKEVVIVRFLIRESLLVKFAEQFVGDMGSSQMCQCMYNPNAGLLTARYQELFLGVIKALPTMVCSAPETRRLHSSLTYEVNPTPQGAGVKGSSEVQKAGQERVEEATVEKQVSSDSENSFGEIQSLAISQQFENTSSIGQFIEQISTDVFPAPPLEDLSSEAHEEARELGSVHAQNDDQQQLPAEQIEERNVQVDDSSEFESICVVNNASTQFGGVQIQSETLAKVASLAPLQLFKNCFVDNDTGVQISVDPLLSKLISKGGIEETHCQLNRRESIVVTTHEKSDHPNKQIPGSQIVLHEIHLAQTILQPVATEHGGCYQPVVYQSLSEPQCAVCGSQVLESNQMQFNEATPDAYIRQESVSCLECGVTFCKRCAQPTVFSSVIPRTIQNQAPVPVSNLGLDRVYHSLYSIMMVPQEFEAVTNAKRLLHGIFDVLTACPSMTRHLAMSVSMVSQDQTAFYPSQTVLAAAMPVQYYKFLFDKQGRDALAKLAAGVRAGCLAGHWFVDYVQRISATVEGFGYEQKLKWLGVYCYGHVLRCQRCLAALDVCAKCKRQLGKPFCESTLLKASTGGLWDIKPCRTCMRMSHACCFIDGTCPACSAVQ